MSFVLRPHGVGVPDRPPEVFPFALKQHWRRVRTFEPYISAGFTDEEAWEALFTDGDRIRRHRDIYGNRPARKRAAKCNRCRKRYVPTDGDLAGFCSGCTERQWRALREMRG